MRENYKSVILTSSVVLVLTFAISIAFVPDAYHVCLCVITGMILKIPFDPIYSHEHIVRPSIEGFLIFPGYTNASEY